MEKKTSKKFVVKKKNGLIKIPPQCAPHKENKKRHKELCGSGENTGGIPHSPSRNEDISLPKKHEQKRLVRRT